MLAAAMLVCSDAHASPTPFDHLGDTLRGAVSPLSLSLYGGAVGGTLALSLSGGDHALRVAVQHDLRDGWFGLAMVYTGYLLPLTVGPSLYAGGLLSGDDDTARAGAAALQATALTFAVTTALKLGTGRPFPTHGVDPNSDERLAHPSWAREFRPVSPSRVAWPSGHTSVNIALAAAVSAASGSDEAAWLLYPPAYAVAAGMLTGDHHWPSDVLAGGLVGYALGRAVGQAFRAQGSGGVMVLPTGEGVVVAGTW